MEVKNNFTKEEVIEYYITQNHSRKETAEFFGIKENTLKYFLKKWDFGKDMKLVAQVTKRSFEKKYGVDSYFLTEECKQIYKQTSLEKYGVEHFAQAPEIKSKTKETCRAKYGTDYYNQTEEFKEKSKQTCLKKYGVEFTTQIPEVKIAKGITSFIKEENDKFIEFKPSESTYEDEVIHLLNTLGITEIECNVKGKLEGEEIDIFVPAYNIGIEFNGNYWHSDIFFKDHNGRSRYHQNKSLLAEKKGIFIFHIYEYEWNNEIIKNNIINRLKTLFCQQKNRIPARNCVVKEISKEEKSEFLNQNHIQGNDHSTINLGLFYEDKLVSCMTFVHPKNNKYTWELSRFCNQHDSIVQGGASKLFKYFSNQLNAGDTVSSYNDITKTKGDLYHILGFECKSINSPNYIWMNFKTGDIRTRYQEQKAGEVERMHQQGYHRICDCGTKTWVYTK